VMAIKHLADFVEQMKELGSTGTNEPGDDGNIRRGMKPILRTLANIRIEKINFANCYVLAELHI